jgi:hypothetical protein
MSPSKSSGKRNMTNRRRTRSRKQIECSACRTVTITSQGVSPSDFTYGQLLTDFKTSATYDRQVHLKSITVHFAPIESMNVATALASAATNLSAQLMVNDIRTGLPMAMTPYKVLSMTNAVTMKCNGLPGWMNTDSTVICFKINFSSMKWTTAFDIGVTISALFELGYDDAPNLI